MAPNYRENFRRQNEILQGLTKKETKLKKVTPFVQDELSIKGDTPMGNLKPRYFSDIFDKSKRASMLITMIASALLMSEPAHAATTNHLHKSWESHRIGVSYSHFGRTRDFIKDMGVTNKNTFMLATIEAP